MSRSLSQPLFAVGTEVIKPGCDCFARVVEYDPARVRAPYKVTRRSFDFENPQTYWMTELGVSREIHGSFHPVTQQLQRQQRERALAQRRESARQRSHGR